MSTFLFSDVVFGPVQSRRLGTSLGINLMPTDGKRCNFDCIYCECGRNSSHLSVIHALPSRSDVHAALERKLAVMQQHNQLPDAITFAGNGEPTIHPDFAGIIDDTVLLRSRYAPQSKISVLTNATMLHRREIVDALKKTDLPILKLDSALDATIALLNQPVKKMSAVHLVEQLCAFGGQCLVQTMFLQGTFQGKIVDNTTHAELIAWERAIIAIKPAQVMIYTIARDTPTDTLHKVTGDILLSIAAMIEKHGIKVVVSA